MTNPIKEEPIRAFLQNIDRAIAQEASRENRAEKQIGDYAVKLIHSEKKAESLSKQLEQTVLESKNAKEKIEELIQQISREILHKKNLEELLQKSQQDLHISHSDIKRLENEKTSLVRTLIQYESRIKELEAQLAKFEEGKGQEKAQNLKNEKEKCELQIDSMNKTRTYVVVGVTAAGLLSGGLLAGLISLGGALTVYILPGSSLFEENQLKQRMKEIDEKMEMVSLSPSTKMSSEGNKNSPN